MAEEAVAEIGSGHKKGIRTTFSEIRKDKLLFALFIIIIILGIAIRLIYPTQPGLWNDDMTTIPTGLLWFYPYDSYPGLSGQGEPAFGNLIVGAGCMLSGQDFSNVSKITPMWYPDRPVLFGEQLTKAEDYCRMPVIAFGVIFFFLVILLALLLLDKYSAIFAISFVAFFPHLLQLSRWIHVDIIAFTFIALGLIFLWKAYSADKKKGKELIFFCLSMIFFAFAFTTKLPSALYLPFAILVMLEKYKLEVLHYVKKLCLWLGFESLHERICDAATDGKPLLILLISGFVSYLIALLPGSEFNPKNLLLAIQKYKATDVMQGSAIGSIKLNISFWKPVMVFLQNVNPLDILVFILAIVVFVKMAAGKKELKERFILFMALFWLVSLFFVSSMGMLRVFTALGFGLVFLMASVFSEQHYSILTIMGLSASAKRKLFIAFIVLYAALSSFSAFSSAPYFEHQNWLLCKFTGCGQTSYAGFAETQTGEHLRSLLANNTEETFEPLGAMHMLYNYIRPEQGYLAWLFRESFRQQTGRMPSLTDKIAYFQPNNRTIRYVIVDPVHAYDDSYVNELKSQYEPNHKIALKHNIEAIWIYDLKNLTKR